MLGKSTRDSKADCYVFWGSISDDRLARYAFTDDLHFHLSFFFSTKKKIQTTILTKPMDDGAYPNCVLPLTKQQVKGDGRRFGLVFRTSVRTFLEGIGVGVVVWPNHYCD